MNNKIINLIIISYIIFFIWILNISLIKYLESYSYYHLFLSLFLGFLSIITIICLFLNRHIKINITVLLISFSIVVLIIELSLSLLYLDNRSTLMKVVENERKVLSKELSVEIDPRSMEQFIKELRKEKSNVNFNTYPEMYLTNKDFLNLFPLGTLSHTYTSTSKESGSYNIIKTDRYGFNNYDEFYDKDIINVLVGDSYTEGFSVNQNETLSFNISESGFNTISLGKGGNGPLTSFATLVEYGLQLEPQNIFWIFSMNDIYNLENESQSEILNLYLSNKNFKQNLIKKQNLINSKLLNYIKSRLELINNKVEIKKNSFNKVKNFIKLVNIRKLIYNLREYKSNQKNFELFENILVKSNNLANLNNINFIFVYLPDIYPGWKEGKKNKFTKIDEKAFRKKIFYIVKRNSIKFIDMHEVFLKYQDPTVFLNLANYGHYNKKGYRIVSDKLIEFIK